MKTLQDNLSIICLSIVIICILLLAYTKGEANRAAMTEEEQAWQEDCMVPSVRSRPSCWRPVDWKAYCEHVQCKE